MRSIWKGHIRFSLVTIPINVYSAIESANDISFNQLHEKDNGRIRYKRECQVCGEEVEYEDIVKGYEYEPEQYVVLTKDELDNVKLESNKSIDIEAFVDIDEVPPSRFEAVYFIGPNGNIAQDSYNLLRSALKKSGKAGVGRIVLRDREDVVLLKPGNQAIIMYKLRYPYELRSTDEIPDITKKEVDDAQLDLANTLIDSLSKTFDQINFEDRYRQAVLELVEAKVEGEEFVSPIESEEEQPVIDITEALKKSIEEAKKKSA